MNQFQANLSVSFLSIISPSEDSPSQDLPDYELLSKARFSLGSRNWLGRACNFKDYLLADSTSLAELLYFVRLSPFKKCNLAWLFWLPSHSLTSGLPSTCCRRSTLERPMQISIRLTESATGRWLVQVLSLIILHWSLSIAFAEKKFLHKLCSSSLLCDHWSISCSGSHGSLDLMDQTHFFAWFLIFAFDHFTSVGEQFVI